MKHTLAGILSSEKSFWGFAKSEDSNELFTVAVYSCSLSKAFVAFSCICYIYCKSILKNLLLLGGTNFGLEETTFQKGAMFVGKPKVLIHS